MDKYILDQNFEKFKSKKLHLDAYTTKKLGIVVNQTILKINDFHLYCIPFDLALRSCNVIMILDKKEVEFFTKSFDKIHSIHFVFQNTMFKKPISLFLRCKIINLKVMNPDTNHCLVSLQYTAIPNDYKEILIAIFKRNEALEFLFKNENFRTKELARKSLKSAKMDDAIHLRTENGSEPLKMLIISTSMSLLKIIGDDSSSLYPVNSRVQIELFYKDDSFFIDGTVVILKDSQEIPGYSIMDIKLDFSNYLTDLLYQFIKKQEE